MSPAMQAHAPTERNRTRANIGAQTEVRVNCCLGVWRRVVGTFTIDAQRKRGAAAIELLHDLRGDLLEDFKNFRMRPAGSRACRGLQILTSAEDLRTKAHVRRAHSDHHTNKPLHHSPGTQTPINPE